MTRTLEKTIPVQEIRTAYDNVVAGRDRGIRSPRNLEQMSKLVQQLTQFMNKDGFKLFHFAASGEKEGVSSIVAGLARCMAREKSTDNFLLVDAHFASPVQHAVFDVPGSPGLQDALRGRPLSECVHEDPSGNIRIMPAGTGEVDITTSTGHGRLASLFQSLKASYDCIVVDSPPILHCADSSSLATSSDITFLVVEANRTLSEVAQKSKLALENIGCRTGGIVLNRVVHVIPKWIYKRV